MAVQSTHTTPPTPQPSAVVPLLQLPPVSQHPAHAGHGAAASAVGVEVDVVLVVVVELEEDMELDDDVVARELLVVPDDEMLVPTLRDVVELTPLVLPAPVVVAPPLVPLVP